MKEGIIMIRDMVPPHDAEKCETKALMDNFCLPPGLAHEIGRSMLLLGTRGSGKTYYLRRCRHKYKGAIIGDLKYILNSITQNTGGAGLSFDLIPPSLEPLIRSKTTALLCTWLASEANERDIKLPHKAISNVLPSKVEITDDLYFRISEMNLEDFENSGSTISFLAFLTTLAKACEAKLGRLLILLDRAENVPITSLSPIFSLLDQSHPFFAIVAARTGIIGPKNMSSSVSITPGDHYDIIHLGSSPYSEKWRNFAKDVLKAWVPNTFKQLSSDVIELILNISRDSLRNAVVVAFNSIDEQSGKFDRNKFEEHVQILQDTLLNAAQGNLRHLHPNLKGIVNRVRRRIDPFFLPVLIQFEGEKQAELPILTSFRELSKSEMFIRLALRAGFLATKNGKSWNPFASVQEVEIPPLYLWQRGDQWYDIL